MSDTSDRVPALEQEIDALRKKLARAEAEVRRLVQGGQAKGRLHKVEASSRSHRQEYFRQFIEHMRDGALMTTETGVIRYCNAALARMLGVQPDQIIGRNFTEFLAGDSNAQTRQLLTKDGGTFECILRGQDGIALPVEISAAPPLIDDGELILGFIVIDLTRHALRLRHEAVVQASKDAIYVLSPTLQIESWNRGAESIFGYSPAEIIGKSERDLCPSSELEALNDLVEQVQARGAAVSVDAIRQRKDGSRIRVILSLTPIRELGGRTIGYAAVAHDITDRMRTEQEARDAMARTALALAAGRMGTFEIDFATNHCVWSDQAYSVYGLDRQTFELTIESIRNLVHPDHQQNFDACLEKAAREGMFETDLRVRHRCGKYIWVHGRGMVRFGLDGRPQTLFGVVADITERKEAEKNQQLLIAELNHRVRNTLATVQAIASQTLRRAKNPAEFVPSFSGRIQALSRAHMLLTKTAWQGAELSSLIREQLLLGGSDRIKCDGPPVSLEPQTALQLALVLHELGTNARKYGSLSVPSGRVLVSWVIEQTGEGDLLHLTWTERDGPPVMPPDSTGFGTLLIERSLQQGQGGQTEISFDPEGLRCAIQLPISPPARGPISADS